MSAFITGIGWVTAGGEGQGRRFDPFDLSHGALPGLSGKITLKNQSFKRFGRMDRYCKLGIKTVDYALQDAGLDVWEEKRDIGLIVSTVLGCLATDIDYFKTVIPRDGLIADPNLFTYCLPNSFIGYAAIIFGLTGTNFVINERTGPGLSALVSAMDCILLGECDTVLAGICDVEHETGIPASARPVPGAIFLVIEKTVNRDVRPYGRISADKKGGLFFNGSRIEDISMCVKKCLGERDE